MEEIKKYRWQWKPVVAQSTHASMAQDNQYIKELPHENGLKRMINPKRKELLDEEIVAKKIRDSMVLWPTPSLTVACKIRKRNRYKYE